MEGPRDLCQHPSLTPVEYCLDDGDITVCEERPEGGLCVAKTWLAYNSWLRNLLANASHTLAMIEGTFVEGYESSCCYRAYSFHAGR